MTIHKSFCLYYTRCKVKKVIIIKPSVLSLSYGKDSIACIEAIKQLGWPLDRVVHIEIWATDTIQADLPPMVEFKNRADQIIKDKYNIDVEHIRGKLTYEDIFYRKRTKSTTGLNGQIYGWPIMRGTWCTGELKQHPLDSALRGCNQYLGIAADEPERIARHIKKPNVKLPLVEIGWDEAFCRRWCEENNL